MPKTISASVGIHGKNLSVDTETVQKLLNNVPVVLGGPNPKLDPDGKCGPKTCNAIQVFQVKQFGWSGADGRVDPDGPTLLVLNLYTPDPAVPVQPPPPPSPEPLATSFLVWLRFTPKFFSHPYDPNEFVFTVVDMTNNREAAYGLKFNGKVGIAPPSSGSGGHAVKVQTNKPTTVSGLVGQAVYQTEIVKGSGPAINRLSSKLFVAMENNTGFVARNLGCHLLKAGPDGENVVGATDPAATPQFIDGQFQYNLNGMFVKLS